MGCEISTISYKRLTTHEQHHNVDDPDILSDNTFEHSKISVKNLYRVRNLILEDLKQPLNLDELAKMAGLNRNKLNEQFRLLFGDTVFSWLREQRLQNARQLLDDSQISVQAIAETCGYVSPPQFSRAFKQRFGLSPSEYRKSVTEFN